MAARIFDEVAGENGLILSVPKTKLLVAGIGPTTDDLALLELDGNVVKVVVFGIADGGRWLGWLVKLAVGLQGPLAVSVILCLLLQT